MTVDAEGRRVDVGGFALHVAEHGDGSPVLVLHGFAGSAARMAQLVEPLSEQHRVIVPDLVGHGLSDAPHEAAAYRWHAVTRQLVGVLDALDVSHAHVLGFSLGGRIALQLAARHDERVLSVLTIGSRCAWPDATERDARRQSDERLAQRIEREGIAALAFEGADEAALATAAPRAGAHGLAHVVRQLGAADQPDVAARLALVAVPLLLAAGTLDIGPLNAAHALAADLPAARVVEIAGAGHRAHLERSDEVAAVARAFFAEVDANQEFRTPSCAPRADGQGGDAAW